MADKLPRSELRQLRLYLEKLPADRSVSYSQFLAVLGISEDYLQSIEQGRKLQDAADFARHRIMVNLVHYLQEEKLLNVALADQFVLDLSERRSVLPYLPPLISLHTPRMQDALLLRSVQELKSHLGRYFQDIPIGYQQKRDEVKGALEKGSRVLLYGLGGAGKSTLAAQIACESIKPNEHLLWLEAGNGSAEEIRATFSKVLRNRKTFAESLRDSQVHLIILDNVWNPKIRPLVDIIPTEIPLLVTSRGYIEMGNRKWILLDGLNEDDALRLLHRYAGSIAEHQENEARILCKQLGYQPQAIVIAGTAIRKSDSPSALTDVSRNLHDYVVHGETGYEATLSVLVEQNFLSPQIKPEHRKAVEQSFNALGALFAAQAPFELLKLLPDMPEEKHTKYALDAYLKDFDMVRFDKETQRYYMHELLHAIAGERCSEDDLLSGAMACKFYVHQQISHIPVQFQALYLVRDNVLGAAEFALNVLGESAENTLFYDLLHPLGISGYFDAKGYTALWLDYLQVAARMAEQKQDYRAAHYLWAKVGNGYSNLAQFEEAVTAYERALSFASGIADDQEAICREAVALCLVGTARFRIGDIALAEKLLFEYAEPKAKNNPDALSQIYEHQGTYTAVHKHDLSSALELFYEALEAAEQVQTVARDERLFYAHINLGEVKYLLADHAPALDHVQRAHQHAVATRKDDLQARALREIYEKSLALNQRENAEKSFHEALKLYRHMDDALGERELHDLAFEYGWPPSSPEDQPSQNTSLTDYEYFCQE
jgi:adenylate kinase family enzyme